MADPTLSAIEEAFAAAGVHGCLHALDVDSGAEIGWHPDEPVVTASVFKLPVLLELFRQESAGEIDAAQPITVPAEGRTTGPFGISVMRDSVTLSLRDLAWLMIAVSDNAATDVVCARVGLDRVQGTVERLGLTGTRVPDDCAGIFATMLEDAGISTMEEWNGELDAALLAKLRALDPLHTNCTTPRDMTRLLRLVWTDEAAAPEACAEVRRVLSGQVWPHRLASGFPEDDVATAGKTGTLPTLRNEVGVVQYADGGRYAVAVFTRSTNLAAKHPAADAVIGRSARLAVEALRHRAGL